MVGSSEEDGDGQTKECKPARSEQPKRWHRAVLGIALHHNKNGKAIEADQSVDTRAESPLDRRRVRGNSEVSWRGIASDGPRFP